MIPSDVFDTIILSYCPFEQVYQYRYRSSAAYVHYQSRLRDPRFFNDHLLVAISYDDVELLRDLTTMYPTDEVRFKPIATLILNQARFNPSGRLVKGVFFGRMKLDDNLKSILTCHHEVVTSQSRWLEAYIMMTFFTTNPTAIREWIKVELTEILHAVDVTWRNVLDFVVRLARIKIGLAWIKAQTRWYHFRSRLSLRHAMAQQAAVEQILTDRILIWHGFGTIDCDISPWTRSIISPPLTDLVTTVYQHRLFSVAAYRNWVTIATDPDNYPDLIRMIISSSDSMTMIYRLGAFLSVQAGWIREPETWATALIHAANPAMMPLIQIHHFVHILDGRIEDILSRTCTRHRSRHVSWYPSLDPACRRRIITVAKSYGYLNGWLEDVDRENHGHNHGDRVAHNRQHNDRD